MDAATEWGAGASRGVPMRVAAWFRSAGRARQALFAFLLFLAVAIALYVTPIAGDFTHRFVGVGKSDAKLYMWSLYWLPYALTHGLSPFETFRVFAPGGADLTWVTTLPAPALVLWPVTSLFGPLAAYNVLLVLAPALAGWATFLLCRRITDRFWPSVAGGYLFGFSTYMVAQLHGHANLVMIWPAPLAAYLVVRRAQGDIRGLPFVAAMAGSLLFLFGSATELFATATVFGCIAFAGALAFGGRLRRTILEAGILVAAAYAVVGFLLLPFLVIAFRHVPGAPIRPLDKASVDLFSFVVPRVSTLIGGARYEGVTLRFTASLVEDGAYLGIPLIAMLGLYLITERRRRETWLLLAFVAVAALLSLGPMLHVLGDEYGTLPGTLLARLPLLEHATPQRFTAYMAIAVSVIAAIWLARAGRSAPFRWALVVVGAVLLLPDLSTPPYHPTLSIPAFFTDGAWRDALVPDEVVYAVPRSHAEELAWQLESDQGFRLAQGYLGPIPLPYKGIPGSRGLALDHPSRKMPLPGDFARYLDSHGVRTVLVDDASRPLFRVLLEVAMGWQGTPDRGVWVYTKGPDAIVAGAPPLVDIAPFVIGQPAPSLRLPLVDGSGTLRNKDLAGRPVVLTFLASWCLDGCEVQLEGIRNLLAEEADITVLPVMLSDSPEDARRFLERAGITVPAVLDPDGLLYLGTGSSIVPTTVVIGADGIVRRVLVDPLREDLFPRSVLAILAKAG